MNPILLSQTPDLLQSIGNPYLKRDDDYPNPALFRARGNPRETVAYKHDLIRHPFYARRGTTDMYNIIQVLKSDDYSFVAGSPQVILDLGAYCGYATSYFASKFPAATIVSVEPEPDNFKMLLMNTRGYENVYCVNACIAAECGKMFLHDGGGEWGYRFSKEASGLGKAERSVISISIEALLEHFDLSHVDLLKIDIEGGELDVFTSKSSKKWVDKVSMISAELHDTHRPGCSDAFFELFPHENYEHGRSGEYYYASKTNNECNGNKTMQSSKLKIPCIMPSIIRGVP